MKIVPHIVCCGLLLFAAACRKQTPAENGASAFVREYTETGDLEAIRQRGQLRILVKRFDDRHLPRSGCPLARQRQLAAAAARSLDLLPRLVYVDSDRELIPALLQGKGDLIAANLIVSTQQQDVAFTLPLESLSGQIIGSATNSPFNSLSDLTDRTLKIQPGTSLFKAARALKKKHPTLQIELLPPAWSRREILNQITAGNLDLALLDSNFLDDALKQYTNVAVLFTLPQPQQTAWGVRRANQQLLGALNRFLYAQRLNDSTDQHFTGDFDAILERGVIRLITRNNASTYFLWRGELLGFEYELASRFAEEHGLRLDVTVAPTHSDMIPMLKTGDGDFVAAFLASTPERLAQGVYFSRPYHYASELVVCRTDDQALHAISNLAGRTLVVRPSSSYWKTLTALKEQTGIDFTIKPAPEDMETEEIIAAVAAGTYDLTVSDSHILDIELTWRNNIRSAFPLGPPTPHGWVVRDDNPKLLAAINRFFDQEYRGLFYNLTYSRYFQNPHRMRHTATSAFNTKTTGSISPYDDIIQKYAAQHDIDWRLITAQIYQESQFNPHAVSWRGAQGLMQLLPVTAHELGFYNVRNPESGIQAGILYLDALRKQLPPEIPEAERLLFALAAYNAGIGHVQDARELATQLELDPNQWFDNTEEAMLLLARPEYARHARHGYCRGSEPVNYVRSIKERFESYKQLTQEYNHVDL
jgi:membrane-bound lytic murein transglycosylase F